LTKDEIQKLKDQQEIEELMKTRTEEDEAIDEI
jgi:hypothetical protein